MSCRRQFTFSSVTVSTGICVYRLFKDDPLDAFMAGIEKEVGNPCNIFYLIKTIFFFFSIHVY